ncbi:hypothetical protein LZG37_03425 [Halomonas titanicae]|uniref:hypothetical protein n=1 Tax=Vreelandella titanicae TaxID=664683 RepID=UPI001F1DBE7A|nr:hypothetical protein [Halomonas titanicae]MCE7517177.1 hypothetical protein [Halomonas titanicae]
MSEYRLTSEIISRSVSDIWDAAKLEWALSAVYEAEEPETCLCGHFPIIELCILHNPSNGNYATVGNCCVKKFLGLNSEKIFQAIKRVRKDSERALNAEAIEHGFNRGWINQWERDFYISTMRKRKLYPKQLAKRIQVNEKFSQNLRRSRGGS